MGSVIFESYKCEQREEKKAEDKIAGNIQSVQKRVGENKAADVDLQMPAP